VDNSKDNKQSRVIVVVQKLSEILLHERRSIIPIRLCRKCGLELRAKYNIQLLQMMLSAVSVCPHKHILSV
jgi:hypothetical protein